MITVDTSVWIDFLQRPDSPNAERFDAVLGTQEVVIGDLVLVEVLQGFRNDVQLRLVQATLAAFRVIQFCGADIAPKAATNFRSLRRQGVTVRGTIDVIIATWCIENDVPLLHNDRDFNAMEDILGMPAWR